MQAINATTTTTSAAAATSSPEPPAAGISPAAAAQPTTTVPHAVSATVSAASVPASVAHVVSGSRRRIISTRTTSPPRAETIPVTPAPATHARRTSRRRTVIVGSVGGADHRVPRAAAGQLPCEVQEHATDHPRVHEIGHPRAA